MAGFSIKYAKAHPSELIAKARGGDYVVIFRGKVSLVRLQPVFAKRAQRKPGLMKGILKVGPEFFAPLQEDELGRWE